VVVVVLIVVAGVAFLGASTYLSYRAKQKRIAALVGVANQLGFEFAAADSQNCLGFPFALFERGDGRGVENVMWGRKDDVAMWLFDYWYYETQSDGRGSRSRRYFRFTCAVMTIDADCPSLRIAHEGFFSRVGNVLGFKDIELEFDDFNKEFRVRCKDQKFAFSLLDGRMMEWLMQTRSLETVEVVGPFVLLAIGKLVPADWRALASAAGEFHAHIPNVVWSGWPRGAS
jgi:hypothetical protein